MSLQDTDTRRRLRLELEQIKQSLTLTDLTPAKVDEFSQAMQRIQSGSLPLPRPAPSGRPARPQPERAAHGPSVYQRILQAVSTFLFHCVRSFRYSLDVFLGLLTLVFLIVWGFQLPHPAHWDNWWWVVQVRQLAEPALAYIDGVLEWPQAKPFYPLAVILLLSIGRIVIDSRLTAIQKMFSKAMATGNGSGNQHPYGAAINWRAEERQ